MLYLQRYSTDFRNLCLSSKMLRVGNFVENFRRAAILHLQWKVKTLRIDNIWNFATFNLYTAPAKILYLQRYSIDFRNLCLSSNMLWVGIWVESFMRAAILLSLFTMPAKIIYLQRNSTDFRNIGLSSTMLTVGIWVESFRCAGILLLQRQVEIFAHVQHLKFPTFNQYTVRAKILYPQRHSTHFRNLCFSSKMLREGIWVESFRRAGILLLQWQGENFAHLQHLKFPHFNLYTVPAKILYLQRYSTDFQNLSLSWKALRVGIWVESLKRAGILLLQWQSENIAHRQHLKFCHFQPVHCASKDPIFRKVFNRFSKSLAQLEDVEGGHLGGKFQMRRYITFAKARWKLCASSTFEILPLSNCTLSEKKSYISKGVQPIFEISASARRCWRWAYVWKITVAKIWYFCNGKVKTLRMYNIWNIPLSTCTLCPQKSYISKGIQPIFEIFASPRRFWGWAFGWKVSSAQVFYFCNGKVKICAFTTFEISHFQPVHCVCKNPISAKVFHRFSKSLPQLGDFEGGHLRGKLEARRYFTFAMGRWKLCVSKTFEILPLSTCTLCQQKSYSSKLFNRFSKSLPQLEDVEGGHLGEKFQVRRYITFAIARWKLCASTTFEILPLSNCTLSEQKSYISKGFQPIYEIFASARRCWRWAYVWKITGAQICYFCNGKVKTLRMYNIWNIPLSTCTLCQQKSYISKGIQPIFEIFASARRFWRWTFGWKVSSAQVF